MTFLTKSARARTLESPAKAQLRLARLALLAGGALWVALQALPVHAGDRLLGTWGVSPVEGGGGGGLSPWGVITGTGSRGQTGGSAYFTRIRTRGGFDLTAAGAAVGIDDRMEFSMSQWSFKLSDTVPGEKIRVQMLGAKVRIAGDAVYDQDTWMPQVAAGIQYKHNSDSAVPDLLGSKRDSDFDFYVSATKVWLGALAGRNLLLNVNLRATRANQFGLLGFGGDQGDGYKLQPEVALGVMLRDDLVVGAEWRSKPDNLSAFKEEDAWDAFIAWFPVRWFSVTAAWVDLGNIANKPRQTGWYVSGQLAF